MCFGGNTHQIIGLQGLKLVSLYQLTVLTGGSGGTCALQSNQEHYPDIWKGLIWENYELYGHQLEGEN